MHITRNLGSSHVVRIVPNPFIHGNEFHFNYLLSMITVRYDLRPYLKVIPKDKRHDFCVRIRAAVPPLPRTTSHAILQSVTAHQIFRVSFTSALIIALHSSEWYERTAL